MNKMQMGGLAVACLCLVICFVTSIISLNCAADKRWQCAQISGFAAGTTGCMMISALVAGFFFLKKTGGGGLG